jgi:hypothetical protein
MCNVFTPPAILWTKSYLSNRTQRVFNGRVFFNGSLSNIIQVDSGVPQGRHEYPTRHTTRGLVTVPKSRTDYGRRTVLHSAMTTWNSISHQLTDASS